jgi:hypothetical protein
LIRTAFQSIKLVRENGKRRSAKFRSPSCEEASIRMTDFGAFLACWLSF